MLGEQPSRGPYVPALPLPAIAAHDAAPPDEPRSEQA